MWRALVVLTLVFPGGCDVTATGAAGAESQAVQARAARQREQQIRGEIDAAGVEAAAKRQQAEDDSR
jgi:hypothetical protein